MGVFKSIYLSELNRLFHGNSLRAMLEGKHYQMLDMVFPFVEGPIDRATELAKQSRMMKLLYINSDLFRSFGIQKQ